ncbi:MAG: prepilin peptidase [Myxococcales bacterium]|nr:prepilin peptidase [Myxococcales bacterium]MDD9966744.1 prepilin peptidase [Myxococcales bacterium]
MLDATVHPFVAALALTGVAAIWDLRTGRIPNRLVLIGALGALGMACLFGLSGGVVGVASALSAMAFGALLVSVVPILLHRLGGLGGGDVKLLAVVGALLGPYLGLEAELYAFFVAVLYAPARLIWERKLLSSMRLVGRMLVRPLLPRARRGEPVSQASMTSFRFGPAIFVGTMTVAVLRLGGVA